jgi:acylphosphatase
MPQTRRLTVVGRVQGVGYRAWAVGAASGLSIAGWVRNRHDGTVEILARGEPAALDALAAQCRSGPAFARVDDVAANMVDDDPTLGPGFRQVASA